MQNEHRGWDVRKPLPIRSIPLYGCLRSNYWFCKQIPKCIQHIRIFLPTLNKIGGKDILEGLFIREGEDIPCVVWGSGTKFLGCLKIVWVNCNALLRVDWLSMTVDGWGREGYMHVTWFLHLARLIAWIKGGICIGYLWLGGKFISCI